jgi:flagellar basal-body rod modification protein FlgD
MSIGATEPVTYTGMLGAVPTAGTDTGATTTTSTSKDKDMFQLLVAQMKYQDPMNPTDSSQFLAQSAQFTALEKMQDVADQTAQLVTSQMAFGASSLVGRTITWTDANGSPQTGAVTGVTFGTDGPTLDVGSSQVSLGQVQSVTGGSSASTASSSASTASTASSTQA